LEPVALVLGASEPDPVVELLRPLLVAFRLALLVFGLLMLELGPVPVWLVPAVGLLFIDRLLPVAAPGTAELHGWPLRPMRPFCDGVVFIDDVPDDDGADELADGFPVVVPLVDDELLMVPPGVVPDGLAPVAAEPDELAPAAPPAAPPAPPPAPAASARPALPASSAAANVAMNGFECGMVGS
jgi:hypothetical protein